MRSTGCRFELRRARAAVGCAAAARLAYRDIASATNRLTLIAAIVPARAVTTHTLFCLKTPLPLDAQQVLCALLNSFVANYLDSPSRQHARHRGARVAPAACRP